MKALKKVFILSVFLVFLFTFLSFAEGASCDISVNPSVVDLNNDYSENPGRITVFGEGSGNSFSESTSIQINCNVDGAMPGANQNIVTARVPAFSQTLLSYKGYCSYKTAGTDAGYKVSATILPDNIACNNGANNYVVVTAKAAKPSYAKPIENEGKGSTMTTTYTYDNRGKLTDETGKTTSTSDDGFGNSLIGAIKQIYTITGGQTKLNNKGENIIDTEQQPKEARFALDWKWSLIGVPYGDIISEDHSCISKIYYYDKDLGKYQKVIDLKDKNLIGKGLWAKKKTGNKPGDCIIKYTGRFLSSQTINLKRGWNLIGIQTEKSFDTTKSSCKITSGPFMYSGFISEPNAKSQGYLKRELLNYGSGYWIKVAEDCTLSSEDEEEAPPAPPGLSEANTQALSNAPAIEPQGVRGRRFIEDAA